MSNSFKLPKAQHQIMIELCQISRQRYLEAGGNPQRSSGTLHDKDYLTEEERKEFFRLGRLLTEDLGNRQEKRKSVSNL